MNDAYGQYRLMERIAEGGMGEVFRARLVRGAGFEKIVAVKRMLPQLSESAEFAAMFRAEARLAARFNHDNVVQVYDFGEQDGTLFLAMEYIDGLDLGGLASILRERCLRIPLRHLLRIGIDACRGLDYLHRLKGEDGSESCLVHRDISPSNILLSFEGQVKITDFGIAAPAHGIDTDWLAGKLGYLSPEQLRGETLDRRSDLYSLGVVLYELLFARRAFPLLLEREELFEAVRNGCIDWNDADGTIPDCLTDALKRACATEKAERFSSALEMRRALEDCAAAVSEENSEDLGRWLSTLLPERSSAAVAAPERTILSTQPITPPQAAIAVQSDDVPQKPAAVSRRGLYAVTALSLVVLAVLVLLLWPQSVRLSLESEPAGALARLDGRRLGTTPLKNARLPQDGAKHLLELELVNFEPYSVELDAADGKPVQHKAVLLRSRQELRVETTPPGARVLLDGKRLDGATPLDLGALEIGVTHSLRLEMENMVPVERQFIIEKRSAEKLTYSYKLESLYARLRVTLDPEDAELYIDGRRVPGQSPFEVEGIMRHRPLELSATRAGYAPHVMNLTPGAEEVTEADLKLEAFECELLIESGSAGLTAQLEGKPGRLPLTMDGLQREAHTAAISTEGGERLLLRASCSQIRDGRGRHAPQVMLNVNARPWAALFIDGRDAVTTPASEVKLGPGRHRLKFSFRNEAASHWLSLTLR